jgi:5'-3' exoribonuclease 2
MDDVQRTAALLRHVSCPPTAGANNFSAAADLRALLRRGNDPKSEASENSSSKFVSPPPRKQPTNDSDEEEPEDNVRLYEDGWRGRYYQNKFSVNPDDEQEFDNFTGKVVEAYVMGLCWVLAYYYQGCPSWKWFYPFHYAPFASDFHDIVDIDTSFDKGKPFRPLEQLMGVFPAASGCFLPDSWRDLMTDADSPIIDFYPTDFRIDLNGKKFAWQGVALLPFVDEARLRLALEDVYSNLTKEEEIRNSCGSDLLFVGKHHPARGFLETLYEQQDSQPLELNPKLARGMAGTLSVDKSRRCLPQKILPSPLPGLPKLKDNGAVCTLFRDPQFPEDFVFSAKCLPGAVHPPKTLKPQDMIGSHPGSYRPTIGFQPRRQPGPNDLPREFTSGHRMAQHHVKSASSFNDRLQRTPYNPYGSVPLSQSFQPPFIPHASPHSAQFGGRPALQRHWSDPRDMYSGMRRWQPNPQPYQDYYSERQREYPKREYPKRDRRNEDQSNYGYGHPPPKRSRQY